MAYIINRYNGTILTTVEDGTINQTTELKFVGKNYAGYGEIQNENMLFLLENFANTSSPTRPISGMLWYDSASSKIKVYDGVRWKTTGGAEVSPTPPLFGNEGDIWWNNTTNQMYGRSAANEWILIGPQSAGAGLTQMRSITLLDTVGVTHAVIAATVEDEVIYIISADEFTIAPVDAIPGFNLIKKGLTLINTPESGVTTTDHWYWGTASNAAKLNGQPASYYDIDSNLSSRLTPVAFGDEGYTLGNDTDLTVRIDTDTVTPLFKLHRNILRFYSATDVLISTIEATGILPGSNLAFNLGSAAKKWNIVYANTLDGTATRADSIKVDGNASNYWEAKTAATQNSIAARDSSGNLNAVLFNGTATKARYADLAEKYSTGTDLPIGTAVAVCSHEDHEVEPANASKLCIGVVSEKPAYLMNSEAEGQAIALKGRVPVRVVGAVKKGQAVFAWDAGVCSTIQTTALIGVALETNDAEGEKLVECVLKV